MVYYDPLRLSATRVQGQVQACLEGIEEMPAAVSRRVEIPTVYGGEYGPDLEFVARHNHLSEAEVVRIHGDSPHAVEIARAVRQALEEISSG
jgi:inhibitor of KinA